MRLTRRRWLLAVVAGVLALVTARLGGWQLDRAAQKTALHDAQQAQRALPPLAASDLPDALTDAPLHRAVTLSGRWAADHTVYLENRPHAGRAGFVALTPLVLDDGRAIVVQRGWLARDPADRTRIAVPPLPPERVVVQARIAPPPTRYVEFDAAQGASGPIRQNLDLGEFARETGLPLLPYSVQQHAGPPDGLLRQWPQPAADVHKNYGYAVQWFALSALVIGLYVWFQLVRPRLGRRT